MTTRDAEDPTPGGAARTASQHEELRSLAAIAHDQGVSTVVVADDDQPLAAVVPIGFLREVTSGRIRKVYQAAVDRDAAHGETVSHADAAAALGVDEHGRPRRAA